MVFIQFDFNIVRSSPECGTEGLSLTTCGPSTAHYNKYPDIPVRLLRAPHLINVHFFVKLYSIDGHIDWINKTILIPGIWKQIGCGSTPTKPKPRYTWQDVAAAWWDGRVTSDRSLSCIGEMFTQRSIFVYLSDSVSLPTCYWAAEAAKMVIVLPLTFPCIVVFLDPVSEL